ARQGAPSPTDARSRPAKPTAPPAETTQPGPLDLNEAGVDDLARLPGLGPGLAQRIVAARDADGRFASVDDLRRVRGLGRVRRERLRPLVTVRERRRACRPDTELVGLTLSLLA